MKIANGETEDIFDLNRGPIVSNRQQAESTGQNRFQDLNNLNMFELLDKRSAELNSRLDIEKHTEQLIKEQAVEKAPFGFLFSAKAKPGNSGPSLVLGSQGGGRPGLVEGLMLGSAGSAAPNGHNFQMNEPSKSMFRPVGGTNLFSTAGPSFSSACKQLLLTQMCHSRFLPNPRPRCPRS